MAPIQRLNQEIVLLFEFEVAIDLVHPCFYVDEIVYEYCVNHKRRKVVEPVREVWGKVKYGFLIFTCRTLVFCISPIYTCILLLHVCCIISKLIISLNVVFSLRLEQCLLPFLLKSDKIQIWY